MFQFVKSHCAESLKIVLWRLGNYHYRIEVTKNDTVATVEFDAEYATAVEKFEDIVKSSTETV